MILAQRVKALAIEKQEIKSSSLFEFKSFGHHLNVLGITFLFVANVSFS